MATLYEIDSAILDCLDEETGEIIDAERLSELQIERTKKLEGVTLWVKNLNADIAAYKAEKDAFAEREKTAKNQLESLKNWLTEALNGEKMTTSKVVVSFRKSEAVEVLDEDEFLKYTGMYDRLDLLTFKDPTPNKTAIKTAIKDGQKIPGCTVILKNNIQIK